ncbi:MAG: sensor histidine kinase [Pseudomonadota bacterium]
MRTSLHLRVLLSALLPLAVLGALGAVGLRAAFADAVQRAFDQQLAEAVETVLSGLGADANGQPLLRRRPLLPAFQRVHSGWYWQVGDRHAPLHRSRSLWDGSLEPVGAAGRAGITFGDATGPAGEALRMATLHASLPRADAPVPVTVAAARSAIDEEIARFSRLLWLGFGGLLVVAAAAQWMQVRLGLAPLRRLGGELAEVEAGSRARLTRGVVPELDVLAAKVNGVLDVNQAMADRGRKLAGDLAHAMKTPLSVLATQMEGSRDPAVGDALARLRDLAERHLARASVEARAMHARTTVGPVLDELAALFARLNASRSVTVTAEAPPGVAVGCAADDLQEVVGNLIDNACRFARQRVHVAASVRNGRVRIEVSDDGPGLDAASIARLGTRGLRLDERGGGSGLGLSIARDIVEALGGEITFDRDLGGGLRAAVELPAA